MTAGMTDGELSDEELAELEAELVRDLAIAEAMNKAAAEKARRVRGAKERRGRRGGQVREFRPRPGNGRQE